MPKAMTIIPSVAMNGGTELGDDDAVDAAEEGRDRDRDRDGQDERQQAGREEQAGIRLRLEHRGRHDRRETDHAASRQVHAARDEHQARSERHEDRVDELVRMLRTLLAEMKSGS